MILVLLSFTEQNGTCLAKDANGTAPHDDVTVTCAFGNGACLCNVSANTHYNAHDDIRICHHRVIES
jgi:hypothetical protein